MKNKSQKLPENTPDIRKGIDFGKEEIGLDLETSSYEELMEKSNQIKKSIKILKQEEKEALLDSTKHKSLTNLEWGFEEIMKEIGKRKENPENLASQLLEKVGEKKGEFDKDGKLSPEQEQEAKLKEKKDLTDINQNAELITQKTMESLYQRIGFVDIEPKDIFESLNKQDLEQLQKLMKGGEGVIALEKEIEVLEKEYEDRTSGMVFEETIEKMKEKIQEKKQQAKILKENEIIVFWQDKVKEIFISQGKESELIEEKSQEIAKNLNEVIQQTINAQAQEVMAKFDWAKGLKLAGSFGKNIGLMYGATMLISALGVTTGGLGVVALAGGLALTRLVERKISKKIREKKSARTEQEFNQKLEEIKSKVLEDFFVDEDKLKKELSGAISNEIRRQTGKKAVAVLNQDKQAETEGKKEIMDAYFSEIEKKFYLNALTITKAEHPEINEEQQHNMAIQMAMTLSQYERNNFEAKKRLDDLKKNKPKVYELIQKFNLWQVGVPDKKPEGMNKEEESLWKKYKYDLISLGLGTAVGLAIRTNNLARMALGTISGIGVGYMLSEMRGKRVERKGIKEIEEMISEAEKVIEDIEFPSEKLPELRENAILVQSKLEIGLLDSDALLKSRAENFIYNVKKIEIANQKFLNDLLKQQQDNNKKLGEQIEKDVDRIENKTKKRRILFMVGGAIGGFLIAEAFTKHSKEAEDSKVIGKAPEQEGVIPEPALEPEPLIPEPESQPDLSDAIVGKGEGPEHAFIRQLIHNPEKFGYEGNLDDASAIKLWAGKTAHRIALDQGIVKTGEGGAMEEIRTRIADKIAYQLERIDDKITVKEIDLETDTVGDANVVNSYEYVEPPKPVISQTPEASEELSAEASKLEPHPASISFDKSKFDKFELKMNEEIKIEPLPISSEVQNNIDNFDELLQQGGKAKEIDKAVENLINNYQDDPSLIRDSGFKESVSKALNHRLDDVLEKGHGLFGKESVNASAEGIVRNFTKINGLSLDERNFFIKNISGENGFDLEDLTRFTQNGKFVQNRLELAIEDFKELINSKSLPIEKWEWTPRILNIIHENGERESVLGQIRINLHNKIEVDYNNDGVINDTDVYNKVVAKNIMQSFEEQETMIEASESQARIAESIEKAKSDLESIHQGVEDIKSQGASLPHPKSGLDIESQSFGQESLKKGLAEPVPEAEIPEIISPQNIPFMERPDWFQNSKDLNLIEFDQEKFNQLQEIISKEVAPTQLKADALEMMDNLKKSYPDMYEKMSAGNYDQPSRLIQIDEEIQQSQERIDQLRKELEKR